ncbi:MAG: hypothetical protein NTY90_03075 [Candidatus Micrarchaeota archaeon]|nr:hypothetical protein [Candidatus Micrarchaeota archaeon]
MNVGEMPLRELSQLAGRAAYTLSVAQGFVRLTVDGQKWRGLK